MPGACHAQPDTAEMHFVHVSGSRCKRVQLEGKLIILHLKLSCVEPYVGRVDCTCSIARHVSPNTVQKKIGSLSSLHNPGLEPAIGDDGVNV
jgi:hypothetical protein